MWDAGCRMPTQVASGRSRCFCGTEIDLACEEHVYNHEADEGKMLLHRSYRSQCDKPTVKSRGVATSPREARGRLPDQSSTVPIFIGRGARLTSSRCSFR